jgi:hypothetical protein
MSELFSRPVDLTIPQSYELQSEIARLRGQRGEKIVALQDRLHQQTYPGAAGHE